MQIRAMHPGAYHSGEWGHVYGFGMRLPDEPGHEQPRPCFYIEWPNGDEDFWPMYDPDAGYQFRRHEDAPVFSLPTGRMS